ncbi:hypothetical protein K1719_035010 [Acacia pycnantha]|nr:hypothetical protein K1719_035010 [Acacia pycnantha]
MADTFGQRTSIYRRVTRHRWTGRYKAHLWDDSCRREGQAMKGRQAKQFRKFISLTQFTYKTLRRDNQVCLSIM